MLGGPYDVSQHNIMGRIYNNAVTKLTLNYTLYLQ
jgi:hypothetical protein